jgi:hypothetical protein
MTALGRIQTMSEKPQKRLVSSDEDNRTLSNDLASLGLGFICCYVYVFCFWIFCVQVPRFLPNLPGDDTSILE